jgi:hypothetical protein
MASHFLFESNFSCQLVENRMKMHKMLKVYVQVESEIESEREENEYYVMQVLAPSITNLSMLLFIIFYFLFFFAFTLRKKSAK